MPVTSGLNNSCYCEFEANLGYRVSYQASLCCSVSVCLKQKANKNIKRHMRR